MKNKHKKFVLKEATRKRCKTMQINEKTIKQFKSISLELYHYLGEIKKIEFSLFFRNGDLMVEFIKPNELSKELLEQMWAATHVKNADVGICILDKDYPKFERVIAEVRNSKITNLMNAEPALDPIVLKVFSDLSSASQLIVKGGIDTNVADRASNAVASMMDAQMSSDVAMGTLSKMIECDSTLYDHSASVAMISGIIASKHLAKPLDVKESELVARCGLYHDTGKTCIPSAVLNKPGRFTPEEFEVMKQHTVLGFKELNLAIEKGAPIEDVVARVALEHHERFTGKGYPNQKKGRMEEDAAHGIHLYTRIVSIADVYSALLMKRVYKQSYSPRKAIIIMKDIAENDFDSEIFEPFYDHVVSSIKDYEAREKNLKVSKATALGEKDSVMKAANKRDKS